MVQKYPDQEIGQEVWRDAMSSFASGVTIVACLDTDRQPQGMTVSAFSSLSMEPPMLLVCMNPVAPVCSHVLASGYFSVNILHADQEELSNKFAIAADEVRFNNVAFTQGRNGCPFINDSLVAIECRLEEKSGGGDHLILLGRPLEIKFGNDKKPPLLYWQKGYRGITS